MLRQFYKVVERLLNALGLSLVKKSDMNNLSLSLKILSEPDHKPRQGLAECIIFSKDRSLQLHALISSYFEKVKNPAALHLLYTSTSAKHKKSYGEVVEMFSDKLASVTEQTSFRENVLEILESIKASRTIFFTDDDVFIENVDMQDYAKYDTNCFFPSLRLGLNLKRCYTYQIDLPVPPRAEGIINEPDKFCWQMKKGTYDWAIPFSVDGNLFSTKEITLLSRSIPFTSPNLFEGNLLPFTKVFYYRYGVCYTKSKLVNIPCNMVQNEWRRNVHGALHQDLLLEKWNEGLQIDRDAFAGIINESAHQELKIAFKKRN
jgi:hypothetical protein